MCTGTQVGDGCLPWPPGSNQMASCRSPSKKWISVADLCVRELLPHTHARYIHAHIAHSSPKTAKKRTAAAPFWWLLNVVPRKLHSVFLFTAEKSGKQALFLFYDIGTTHPMHLVYVVFPTHRDPSTRFDAHHRGTCVVSGGIDNMNILAGPRRKRTVSHAASSTKIKPNT